MVLSQPISDFCYWPKAEIIDAEVQVRLSSAFRRIAEPSLLGLLIASSDPYRYSLTIRYGRFPGYKNRHKNSNNLLSICLLLNGPQ